MCRREAMKLFLKGERCFMAKCPIETGRPAPGMHGARRRRKDSGYGLQLREKQRLRRTYGLREEQFRQVFKRAVRSRGVTGERLLQLLELRIDNIAYRLGFAPSRAAARQFVRHNHVRINGKTANIPSMVMKVGDKMAVKDRPAAKEYARQYVETAEGRGIVAWLALNKEDLSGEVLRLPTRDEIAPNINEQLVVELYSK